MNTVIVGGPHSGVGKTLACERVLQALSGHRFGAIKLTVADGEFDANHDHGASAATLALATGICGRGTSCGVCETVSSKVPSRTIISPGAIQKSGTDTWRLSSAGAVAVAWVIALRSAAPEAIEGAIAYLQSQSVEGILIEGTTALEWMRPTISVMVAADPGRKWKSVAVDQVLSCDIVLHNRTPVAPGNISPPDVFYQAAPLPCDLGCDDDPGTVAFARRLRELYAVQAARA